MIVVLDSWAIMRLLESVEPVASRVQEQVDSGDSVMSWINLGEVFYVLRRAVGEAAALDTVRDIESAVRVLAPDRTAVLDAARIKAEHRMSYADSFAAATAAKLGCPLWTGDPELLVDGASWNPVDPSA